MSTQLQTVSAPNAYRTLWGSVSSRRMLSTPRSTTLTARGKDTHRATFVPAPHHGGQVGALTSQRCRCRCKAQPSESSVGHVAPDASTTPSGPLSPSQVEEFERCGVVIARGLVSGPLLDRAVRARRLTSSIPLSEYEAIVFRTFDQEPVFRELALRSPMAAAAAQLTPAVARGEEPLHLLRDALFAYSPGNEGCGWHVDDRYFWPASDEEPPHHPGPGVNVWLALDPVTEHGGGLAVAPGSHTDEFASCRAAIRGQSPGGGAPQTCHMEELSPESHARLEALGTAPALRPGDAIIHTRWLFHRSDPFDPSSEAFRGPPIARYSVRYVPGSTKLEGLDRDPATNTVQPLPTVEIRASDPDRFPRVPLGASTTSA